MRLISLVIGLLIVAFLVHKQLSGGSTDSASISVESAPETLKVPTKPEELEKFEKDLDALVKESAEEATRRIEEAEK